MEGEITSQEYPVGLGSPSSGEVIEEMKRIYRFANGGEMEFDKLTPFIPQYGMVNKVAGSFTGVGITKTRSVAGPVGCEAGCCFSTLAAHEVGHTDIGLAHVTGEDDKIVACGKTAGGSLKIYPLGRIGGPDDTPNRYFGFDVGNQALQVPLRVMVGDESFDFMTYCKAKDKWVSEVAYMLMLEGVLDRPTERTAVLDEPVLPFPQNLIPRGRVSQESHVLASLLQETYDRFLWVSASINLTKDQGTIGSMLVLPTTDPAGISPEWLPPDSPITVRLEAQDSSLLAEYPINFDEPERGPAAHAENDDRMVYPDGVVPWLPGVASISLLYEGDRTPDQKCQPQRAGG